MGEYSGRVLNEQTIKEIAVEGVKESGLVTCGTIVQPTPASVVVDGKVNAKEIHADKIVCKTIETTAMQYVSRYLAPGESFMLQIGGTTLCVMAQPQPEVVVGPVLDWTVSLPIVACFLLMRLMAWVKKTYERGCALASIEAGRE